ncbi:MAG: LuxR C-terminal-related transcriptional regulator [Candidatus Nanopelagicales bacterium]
MGNWPLIGRADEMDLLLGRLDGDAGTGGAVIAGGAGVGKTRLAREAAMAAAQRGWIVHSLQGTSSAQSIPLGIFSQWISQLDDQPLNLVSSVIAAVTASPTNAPVLVVVDDVHLLDDLSAFVLHQLVRREAATVIATLRTGEPVPKSVTELWKDGDLQRLDLQPLARDGCTALLAHALDGSVNDQIATRMWELTHGNVLFLRELVRQERQTGRLIQADNGQWTWTGSMTVSPSLADLVDTYIGGAPEPVIEVLDLLAVAEPLELSYLSLLADPEAIEEAERLDLIRVSHESPTDLVRIGHPLYGEACRSRLGKVKARRLRGRIAGVMSAPNTGAAPTDPVRLALLWLESDLPGDADVHHRGAAAAFRRIDTALSEQLAEAAIRAGAGRGMKSRILHARTLSMLGRGEEAEQLLAALPAGDELDDDWVAAKVLRALNLLLTLGRPEQSWAVIEEALAEAPAQMDQELLAFRAVQLSMAARPAEVVSLLGSIDYSQLTADARINLNYGTTVAFGELGQLEQATQTSEDIFVLGPDSPVNAFQAVSLAQMQIDALTANGKISEAMGLSERVVQQWTDLPEVPRSIAAALTGVSALAHGDLPTARETLSAAIANEALRLGVVGLPFFGIGYWLRIAYTEALARAGDVDAAQAALAELQDSKHPSFVFLQPNRLLAAAWVAAARGRTSEALDLVVEATDFARTHDQHAREVMCLQSSIQLGDKQDHTKRLAELAFLVETPRALLVARWASALAAHDGDALLVVSSDLEAMGDRIGAADAAAHAAQEFHRQNLRGSKLTASARATRLIAECSATTPATREIAAPLPLSNREREIATLVRDGLSNKEIADTLTMSVRTVEGHIYRACNKVGLANRAELGELIGQFAP